MSYSDEQIEILRNNYKGENNKAELAEIAVLVGKSVPSVRTKLSFMGIYKPTTIVKRSKYKKKEIMDALIYINDIEEHQLDGLNKATSDVLLTMLKAQLEIIGYEVV